MKRVFGIAAMSLLSAFYLEAAELNLEASTGAGSARGQLQVRLAAATEIATGLQFDLEYDASRFEIEVLPGPSAELAEKIIRTATPQTNRMRVLVFGMNQTVITNGVVAVIRATAINADDARAKSPVRIVSMAATDRAGHPVEIGTRDSSVPTKPDATK